MLLEQAEMTRQPDDLGVRSLNESVDPELAWLPDLCYTDEGPDEEERYRDCGRCRHGYFTTCVYNLQLRKKCGAHRSESVYDINMWSGDHEQSASAALYQLNL